MAAGAAIAIKTSSIGSTAQPSGPLLNHLADSRVNRDVICPTKALSIESGLKREGLFLIICVPLLLLPLQTVEPTLKKLTHKKSAVKCGQIKPLPAKRTP